MQAINFEVIDFCFVFFLDNLFLSILEESILSFICANQIYYRASQNVKRNIATE